MLKTTRHCVALPVATHSVIHVCDFYAMEIHLIPQSGVKFPWQVPGLE